jgi:uncharacterized protein (DUF58 family)
MKLRTIAISVAAIMAGAALALLGPASPAVGFFSPPLLLEVAIHPTATSVAKGAAVEVRLDVTCAGTNQAFLFVMITQRSGSEIASGRGSATVGCTGQQQSVILLVTADSGRAFKTGSAVAEAELSGCAPAVCGTDVDTRTIRIEK